MTTLRRALQGVFFLPCKVACLHGVVTLFSFRILQIEFPFFAALMVSWGAFPIQAVRDFWRTVICWSYAKSLRTMYSFLCFPSCMVCLPHIQFTSLFHVGGRWSRSLFCQSCRRTLCAGRGRQRSCCVGAGSWVSCLLCRNMEFCLLLTRSSARRYIDSSRPVRGIAVNRHTCNDPRDTPQVPTFQGVNFERLNYVEFVQPLEEEQMMTDLFST